MSFSRLVCPGVEICADGDALGGGGILWQIVKLARHFLGAIVAPCIKQGTLKPELLIPYAKAPAAQHTHTHVAERKMC